MLARGVSWKQDQVVPQILSGGLPAAEMRAQIAASEEALQEQRGRARRSSVAVLSAPATPLPARRRSRPRGDGRSPSSAPPPVARTPFCSKIGL